MGSSITEARRLELISANTQTHICFIISQEELASVLEEIGRLRERLEIGFSYRQNKETGEFVRIEGDDDAMPDGIECRDDTIKLLDESVSRLRKENDRLRDVVREQGVQIYHLDANMGARLTEIEYLKHDLCSFMKIASGEGNEIDCMNATIRAKNAEIEELKFGLDGEQGFVKYQGMEIEGLKHDLRSYMDIAKAERNEVERLRSANGLLQDAKDRAERAAIMAAIPLHAMEIAETLNMHCLEIQSAARDGMAAVMEMATAISNPPPIKCAETESPN